MSYNYKEEENFLISTFFEKEGWNRKNYAIMRIKNRIIT